MWSLIFGIWNEGQVRSIVFQLVDMYSSSVFPVIISFNQADIPINGFSLFKLAFGVTKILVQIYVPRSSHKELLHLRSWLAIYYIVSL